MALKSTKKPRRTDPRKLAPLGRVYPWQRLGRKKMALGLLMAMGFAVLAAAVVHYARSQPIYRVGQVADRSIYARVELVWIDREETEREIKKERDETPSAYKLNTLFLDQFRQELITLPGNVANAESVRDVLPALVNKFGLYKSTLIELKTFQNEGQSTAEWQTLVDGFFAKLREQEILRSTDYQDEQSNRAKEISRTTASGRKITTSDFVLINLANEKEVKDWVRDAATSFPEEIRDSLAYYYLAVKEPTYVLDEEATEQAKLVAAEAVMPVPRTFRPDGEPMVPAGKELDDAEYRVLALERETYLASLDPIERLLHTSGPVALVVLVTVGLVGAVMAMRRRIAENTLRGLALGLLLSSCLLLAVLVRFSGANVTIAAAVGATLLAAVIITIAYDQMFALVVATLLSILVALALQLSMGALVVTLAGCVVGIAQLREVRQRGKLTRAALVTGLVVAVGVWGAGLTERNLYADWYYPLIGESLWGLIAALAVGFFVLGVLPFIERAFKVTTAMTLLEWSDVNQPLLRRLAQAAPGTYNHSLSVATIAEAAADAIGANGLLVRVGAYYHDIGKMNKPQYFVENQAGGPNRHAKLSPAMSLLIIVGHVKDGMEMAREYRLPPILHHFIESHHGTTLVEYFYHTARQRTAEDPGAAQPSEFEFRYPGPKPTTREAAILLLSDSVEAGCRTMNDPTAGRIEQFVHNVAMKRLMDGQFAECGLTLAELARVEAALTKSLCGIYHSRIAYPTEEKTAGPHAQPRTAGPSAAG